jgi:hypothetical protein
MARTWFSRRRYLAMGRSAMYEPVALHYDFERHAEGRGRSFKAPLMRPKQQPLFWPRPRHWRVSEWLAASLEMKCPVRGCGFESRALR